MATQEHFEIETGFEPVLVGLAEPAATAARRAGVLVLSNDELADRLLQDVPAAAMAGAVQGLPSAA